VCNQQQLVVSSKAPVYNRGQTQGAATYSWAIWNLACLTRHIMQLQLTPDKASILPVCCRHFGGTKLGAGGLVRAYGGAARDCLRAAQKQFVKAQVGAAHMKHISALTAIVCQCVSLLHTLCCAACTHCRGFLCLLLLQGRCSPTVGDATSKVYAFRSGVVCAH
jgi:hypothetical protein